MSSGFELYLSEAKRLERILKDPHSLLAEIKRKVQSVLPEARVYLFGSIARGKYTPASDIDILIVLDSLQSIDVDRVKTQIKRSLPGLPLDLHITDKTTFEKWYKRFIDLAELLEE